MDGAEERLGVARKLRISLGQHLGKATSDDGGHLCHQVGDFLPFMRQQIPFELGVNGPLRLNLRAFPADENMKQLDVP